MQWKINNARLDTAPVASDGTFLQETPCLISLVEFPCHSIYLGWQVLDRPPCLLLCLYADLVGDSIYESSCTG